MSLLILVFDDPLELERAMWCALQQQVPRASGGPQTARSPATHTCDL